MEKDKKCCIKTSIGGQALIEGIMMRGPKNSAMAVRKTDGSISLEAVDVKAVTPSGIKKVPVIRGAFAFIDSMVTGYKALMRSAELSMPTEEELAAEEAREAAEKAAKKARKAAKGAEGTTDAEEPASAQEAPETEKTEAVEDIPAVSEEQNENGEEKKESEPVIGQGGMTAIMILGVVLGFVLTLFLFKFIPETIYEWTLGLLFKGKTGYGINLLRSAFTGILKIMILVGYMAAVSCIKDIRRTFMYHGAEHKTIFCYEHGEELTVENVRKQIRFHPRCGTSFIVLSVLVSIFVTMFIPANLIANPFGTFGLKALNVLARTGISLLLLPLIMGLGYELIRLAGKHDNWFTRAISAPGVWLQHITTKEPDDSMIECAIAAVKEVIPDDGSDRIE